MVVIQLDRPRTNLEALSGIFQKVAANIRKIEREKRLQALITGAREQGKEVTTTIDPKTAGIGGISIKDQPSAGKGFGIGGPIEGTRAVTVPGVQRTINTAQALGGTKAPSVSIPAPALAPASLAPAPTPSLSLKSLPPKIDPLQGQLVIEKGTAKRAGETITAERRPLESELERAGERKAQESLRTAQLKDVEKRKVNLRSSKLKLGNSLRSFIDVGRRTEQLVPGVKPGVLGGSISFILGKTKLNEFVRGFVGGLTEVAAAVGATAIPNARAVRLVSLFKGTGIGRFDTIESGVQTTADSIVNGMSGDMAAAPWEYIFGNLPTERQAKAEWDKLTRNEQTEIVDTVLPQMLENFEDAFVSESLNTIFDEDPQLLGDRTIKRIESERQIQRNTFTTPSGDVFTINQ